MNYSDLSTEQQMIAETKKYVNNKALDVQSDWNESDSSAGDYIKNKPTLGTAAVLDVASSGDASSSQVVKGDDSRLTDSRDAADVYSWAKEPTKPTYTASEVGAYTKTESDNKYVAKETGKGLSTNDYTTADKNKLADIEAEANKTVVDSEMSDSSTNPLQNKVITKELEGTKTTSGNPLTIEDAAPVNAVNLSMDLEPVQDLHGYDHPWVGGAGKNLYIGSPSFDGYAQISGWTKQTETYNGHDVYKRNSRWAGAYKAINLATGTYTFSAMVKVGSACNIHVFALLENVATATLTPENKTVSLLANTWTRVDFTFEVTTAGKLALRVENGNNDIDTYISEYQLEAGNQATSYADYENICPISGRSEVAIQRVGKNLIGLGTSLNGYAGNTTFTDSDTAIGFYFETKILPDTITINAINGNRSFYSYYNEIPANGVAFEEKDQTQQTLPRTITVNKNYKYIHIQFSYNETNVTNTQIELGTTATAYEPYNGQTYTIDLDGTRYGGKLDVLNGVLTVEKAYVDLGTLNWTLSDGFFRTNDLISTVKKPINNQTMVNAISSVYPIMTWAAINTTDTAIAVSVTGQMIVANPNITNVSDFVTAVTGQTLVYELATPFTIDLTPQQIKLLENNNTISTDYDGDTITLEYQPNNAIGEAVRVVEENYETRVSLLESRNTAKVYGFHISSTESDPAAKVTYLADAVGMTPAHMNFLTGKFDYGSWEDVWFVRDTKPCLLKDNGQIHRYLNKNNFLKDIDGNDTGVPQITIHTMIEFPKIWYKVVPDIDGKGASIYISPVKVDADYVDYPYIDYQGIHKEHFYMPAYNGSTQTESGTTYLCSTYGETVSKSLTAEQEIAYCKAHGNGWNTEDAGSIMLINFLLILMGKSTDVQSVFGQGLHTSGTEAINNGFTTGIHYNKGMFYGTNSGTIASNNYSNAVKVFGIENYWGFQWRRYAGDILVDGVRKIKLCYGNEDGSSTFDYNLTGNGYVNVGATPSGALDGYISEMKFTKTGMYSKVSSGSSSTYYCDGQWYNNSGTRYAVRGGGSYDGALCGAFYVGLHTAPSGARWRFGVGLEYK